jgi:two-component system sensor histidine kinase PhoQ
VAKARRPLSITSRLVLATSLVLGAFALATGIALDRAFEQSQQLAIQQRLEGFFYSYLQGTDIGRGGDLILPEVLPEQRFERPGSGLYAAVRGETLYWTSPSMLGRNLPFEETLQPGEYRFIGPIDTEIGQIFVYERGVRFSNGRSDHPFTFYIAEHIRNSEREREAFRDTLLVVLGGSCLLLLLAQGLILRWAMRPLRDVTEDLARVERGEHEALDTAYPAEVEVLTESIDRFIKSERDTLKRYRNTLGDLAHSLKTPLAVIRGSLESASGLEEARDGALPQVKRMDDIVAYQLARARASGHATYAAPVAIDSFAEEIVNSLEKVYASRGVLCEFDLDPQARFHGEPGDIQEVLGNLLDNAFKWAKSRVLLTTRAMHKTRERRAGLLIRVEDDGPGIPPEKVEALLKRGVRGDERVQGHGIGMSIVLDVVESYRGQLSVHRSEEMGGAAFEVLITPL